MFVLARNWWAVVLRGVAALLFGVLCLARPGLSLASLVLLFGAYAFADGVLELVFTARGARAHQRWGPLLVEGLVSIGVGLFALLKPGLTALALLFVIAVRALAVGLLALLAAFRLRSYVRGEWRLALAGLAALALGVALLAMPGAGLLALVLVIGVDAVVFGAALVALGLRLRASAGARPPDLGAGVPA